MSKKLAEMVLGVRTMTDVNALLAEAAKVGLDQWVPVGDRPNNVGTIRVASDPGLALVERVTNAIDAMLELGRHANPTKEATSPRHGGQLWYAIPKSGLGDMDDTARRALGENIQIELAESGDKKRPTVLVRDRGIGQPPEGFSKTLLSLNESNKRGELHQMGAYGQGGAATFGFSKATVVISRRHPKHAAAGQDEIGWTIVMEKWDSATEKFQSYKYLVSSSKEVPRLDAKHLPEIDHGTTIIHIAYDLRGLTGPFTALRGGLWQFLHAALFDPVLPFTVNGSREADTDKKTKKPYGSRVVIGNAARLNARIEVDEDDEAGAAKKARFRGKIELNHHDSHEFDLGPQAGKVRLNYWALGRPEDSDSDDEPAASYVTADSAVVMTVFGQRQDAESRIWIKDQAKLPFLYKSLVVQIDADDLKGPAKSELFASTRERATNSEIKQRIYEALAEVLRRDEDLKELNRKEKEKLLKKSTTSTNKKIQDRLAKFVKTKLDDAKKAGHGPGGKDNDGTGGDDGWGKDRRKRPPVPEPKDKDPNEDPKPRHPREPRSLDDTALPEVPTDLIFAKKKIRIYQAGRASVWVKINAKNGYLPDHADDLTITISDPNVRATTRSKLMGGQSRWGFEALGTAPAKATVTVRAELMTAGGMRADEMQIEILESPEENSYQSSGAEEDTGPKIQWVEEKDWPSDYDARTVGHVAADTESTIIFVNKSFGELEKYLASSKLTATQIEVRRDRYLLPVACALWLQDDARRQAREKAPNEAPSDDWCKREMSRLAEAVLLAITPDSDLAKEEGE